MILLYHEVDKGEHERVNKVFFSQIKLYQTSLFCSDMKWKDRQMYPRVMLV